MVAPQYGGPAQSPDSQGTQPCMSVSVCVHGADVLEMCTHGET